MITKFARSDDFLLLSSNPRCHAHRQLRDVVKRQLRLPGLQGFRGGSKWKLAVGAPLLQRCSPDVRSTGSYRGSRGDNSQRYYDERAIPSGTYYIHSTCITCSTLHEYPNIRFHHFSSSLISTAIGRLGCQHLTIQRVWAKFIFEKSNVIDIVQSISCLVSNERKFIFKCGK